MIDKLLKDKTGKQKAKIKAEEICKENHLGKTKKGDLDIEITAINEIDGGVEVLARAWKNNKQLGFGKDGSVDIERFRIYNPPVLVDDKKGDIIREWTDIDSGELKQRKLKFNPKEAILQSLEHTIEIVGKKGNIVKGKIGNTTSTLYPNAGSGTAPVDGLVRTSGENNTFTYVRDKAVGQGAFTAETTATTARQIASTTSNQFQRFDRSSLGFDTSVIDTDTISSAVFSLYVTSTTTALDDTDIDLVSHTPNSESTLITADYNITTFGTTRLATGLSVSGLTTSAYNDWTLNASGLSFINKSGNSIFGLITKWDFDDSFGGTWSSGLATGIDGARFADYTGTASDPKLVVEHSEAVAGGGSIPTLLTLGVG